MTRRPTDPKPPEPTPEFLAGQVVMPRLDGGMPAGGPVYERVRSLIQALGVGGFIVFGGNRAHTPSLLRHLQSLSRLPLLFASDLEEGAGQQVSGYPRLPTAMALAACASDGWARRAGAATARAAKEIGIHWVLAPVCDVNLDPRNPIINVRAFGDDPARAGAHAAEFLRGLQDAGVAGCAKHFPGHGGLDRDSHSGLPVLRTARPAWDAADRVPFAAAFDARAASAMLGHIAWPAVDEREEMPASLSGKAVAFLRREMKFEGLLVTDALDMGGVKIRFSEEKAATLALEAGVDILLHPSDPEKVVLRLRERSGRDPSFRMALGGAAHRVLRFKQNWSARASLLPGEPEAPDLAGEAARAAVTLLRTDGSLLPFPKGIGTGVAALALADDRQPAGVSRPLEEALRARTPDLAWLGEFRGRAPDLAPSALETHGRVLVATFSRGRAGRGTAGLGAATEKWLASLSLRPLPLVLASLGSPYVLAAARNTRTILAAYSECEASCKALASALYGEFPVRGKCPVSIPGVAERGAGIVWVGA